VHGAKVAGPQRHPLYLCTIWAHGARCVFPLYDRVLEAIHGEQGDQLICRVHAPFVTFRVLHPDQAIPVGAFTVDELPPKQLGLEKPAEER